MKIDFIMGTPKGQPQGIAPTGMMKNGYKKMGNHVSGKTLLGHDDNDDNGDNIDIVGVPLVGTQ
jgi:hypothetical protein